MNWVQCHAAANWAQRHAISGDKLSQGNSAGLQGCFHPYGFASRNGCSVTLPRTGCSGTLSRAIVIHEETARDWKFAPTARVRLESWVQRHAISGDKLPPGNSAGLKCRNHSKGRTRELDAASRCRELDAAARCLQIDRRCSTLEIAGRWPWAGPRQQVRRSLPWLFGRSLWRS